MVYGRLFTFKNVAKSAIFLAVFPFLFSCQEVLKASKSNVRSNAVSSFYYTGKGYVYERNPIIASGNSRLGYPSMGDYVTPKKVTDNSSLASACFFNTGVETSTTGNCFMALGEWGSQTPLQAENGGWGYSVGSDEFYQVNAFYHVDQMLKRFYEDLSFAHSSVHYQNSGLVPPATKVDMENTKSFWFAQAVKDPNDPSLVLSVENSTLKVYSKCSMDQLNAYFSPARNEICMGWNPDKSYLYMIQDPSVLYHELGHALVKIMMNQRNISFNFSKGYHATPYKSDLGVNSYDEAGAINEGLSDWFSYYMTGRTHIGEWGMTREFKASRPMTEEDELHKGLVSKSAGDRLSYPQYLHYDPNSPDEPYEDIHYAGQIVSHYLVSLTEEFKGCSSGSTAEEVHKNAAAKTLLAINETLAELGDMTARGSDIFDKFRTGGEADLGAFFTNLNNQQSYLWGHHVNPPNFRRFFQTFAKAVKDKIINANLCVGFTRDESEQLLDEYGLLLFNDYGELKKGVAFTDMGSYVAKTATNYYDYFMSQYGGCLFNYCPNGQSTEVNSLNRRQSVLVSKDYLEHRYDKEDVTPIYIVDDAASIESYLAALTFEGAGVQISKDTAGVEYNNNNIQISPGEVVGVMLNLFNNSNSTMAGVQLLANDWDHMKLLDPSEDYVNITENRNAALDTANWAPCQFDNWPLKSEGGQTDADPNNPAQGDCGYSSRDNFVVHNEPASHPKYYQDAPQPVCMVQYSADNETQWVSQDFFRRSQLDLTAQQCLNPPEYSGDEFNPNECLIRFLPGANNAILSKIDPQKSYTQTRTGSTTSQGLEFNDSQVMLMEVNKRISPGTTFNCRLRARFTNCSDCYENPDTEEEYAEYEMSGNKPFKIINFKFTVLE